jgi:hypothetical protein
MLAAEPDHLARNQHHLDAQHIIGRQPVFETVHAARVLRHVASNRAGDLRRRIRGIIEASIFDGARDGEVRHPGLRGHRPVGEIDIEDAIELAHAQKHPIGKRQRAP